MIPQSESESDCPACEDCDNQMYFWAGLMVFACLAVLIAALLAVVL